MADTPSFKTRDMLSEAMKVVDTHQRIKQSIAERAAELQRIRDEQQQQMKSDEIVKPYGT